MRVRFEIVGNDMIKLPFSHSPIQQGLIYTFLEKEAAKWLHNQGFEYEKRSFKMFTFSDIIERGFPNHKEKRLTFPNGQVSFYVASPVDWILQQSAQNLIASKKIRLGSNDAYVSSISVLKQETITSNKIKVKTLSPITMHSTFEKPDGKKVTHYYSPFENDFEELIKANLHKKWQSLYREACPYNNFSIKPMFGTNRKEKIRYFKGTLIKGWTGMFEIEGDPKLLQFALDTGLGDRNSQGYGMVEMVINSRRNS
jgi:CRISPR-associated endoribonuclease Cas6